MPIPNVRQEVDVVRQIMAKVKAALALMDVAGNPCQSHIGSTDVLPIAKLGYMLGVDLGSILNQYGQPGLVEDAARTGQYESIHVNTLMTMVENQIQLMYNLTPIAPAGIAGAVDYGQTQQREAYFGPPQGGAPQPVAPWPPQQQPLPDYSARQFVNPPVAFPQQPPAPATFTPPPQAPVAMQPQPVDPTMAAMFGEQQAQAPVPQSKAPLTPGQQLGYEPLPGAVPQQTPIPINPAQALGLEQGQHVDPPEHEPTAAEMTASLASELQPEPPRKPGQALPSAEGKVSIPAIPVGEQGDVVAAFNNQSEGHIPTMVDRIPTNNSNYMMVEPAALDQMMTTRGIEFDPGEDKSWKIRRLDAYDNAAKGQLSLAQSR